MTDKDLIAKRLAMIETYVEQLHRLARPDQIERDLREERFVEHTLQIAIQAAIDVASHIVSDRRLGEPRTNRELFDLLASGGWIATDLAERLRQMAGFRNLLVHEYARLDLQLVREVVEHHLDDLLELASAIRRVLSTA